VPRSFPKIAPKAMSR